MEFNSGVSMILPDSIELNQNDYDDEDHEDTVHEQTNQNEIVELIMAAFQGHDEPSDEDDDDDESSNTSDSSHQSSDEQQLLNVNNNNNNNMDEQNELFRHQPTLFPNPTLSTSPPLVPLNNIRGFQITKNEEDHSFNPQTHLVSYQSNPRLSDNSPPTALHYVSTIDINDPQQVQYLYQTSPTNSTDTQSQLNRLRILCDVKDRKASQLQNLCEEYREKYENDTQAFQHKLESIERSKYDLEQRYQSINTQYEELIEKNNQLNRTVKDSELRIQQLEATKTQFETISHYEVILSTTREKHEQEIVSFNEKLQNIQMNLQEKTIHADELRAQLEIANKNNEKTMFERIETINHLNEQLHDYQRKYTDLLTTTSLESVNHTELKRQLTYMTEDKTKLESKCQELQSEIRTLREDFNSNNNENEINNAIFSIKSLPVIDHDSLDDSVLDESILNENTLLKQRINEYVHREKQLKEMNDELKTKLNDYEYHTKRSDSSSSSSSNETVITTSFHTEQIRKLTNQLEKLKQEYTDLHDKYDYEKQELQMIIEQLREDVNDLYKTKQMYIDVCQEKNSIEDTLRSKLDRELKIKLDEVEKEYNGKILSYNHNQEMLEQDKQIMERKHSQDLEQQSKELHQEMDRIKIKSEKQIMELNNELDRFRTDDDAKNRLVYIEKEFEQLKHDYYDLNLKQTSLLKTCSTLENENENLLNSLEKNQNEKQHLTQAFENEIKQLNEHHRQEFLSLHKQTDHNEINFKDDIESLQIRLNNYENVISQYEEYRIKLENNLQKLTQQRDTNKVELRLTKEMLTNKEDDYNQLKLHFEQCEKLLQNHQEKFRQYENTINDLERQITQYELQTPDLNQTRLTIIQETEFEYREKLLSMEAEKNEVEQRLQEANRALDLADSHLKQEIEKIKISLEQEYNHLYERDQKKHQQDLQQLRQQLTNEFNRQRSVSPSKNSLQDIEEMQKMYRTEIDRLYRENLELSQHQSKLIDAHQKQMQIMKKELDDGYNKVINEFQHEQTRLQTRCDQLKQQLNDAQQLIEQLKQNLNQLKTNHYDDLSRGHEHGNRKDHLQNRLENLVKLLEQSNNALNQERILNSKKENEHQQTINSLQKKITDINKQYTKSIDEMRREFQQERSKRVNPRPISVPDFGSADLSPKEITSIEKLRELFTNEMIALLQLTCKMIFDVHHRVIAAHYMDHLDMLMKKQIQNELIRSRNSMIKEIRREIFEKLTYALRSQGVPDKLIDLQIFELDRLLSQMVQDCLNSLPPTSLPVSTTSVLSLQITPQHHQSRSNISNSSSSSPNKSKMPLKKSIECLYMTPTVNKQKAPIAPHSRSTFDIDRRPKSASTVLIANQNPVSSFLGAQKFQRSSNNSKLHRSEDDLVLAMQRNQNNKIEHEQPNVRELAKQFEVKNKFSSVRSRTIDIQIMNNDILQEEDEDEDELSWPQQPISTISSAQSGGIKKFVRNSLKLFITQPQQYKRTGK